MTFEQVQQIFREQKSKGLDPIMIKWENDFYIMDRLTHQFRCKEIGHIEAMKEGWKNYECVAG